MASVVLYEKEAKKYSCTDCMDKSNFLAQGRSEEWAAMRIKRKLIAKGCLSDSKAPVLRLNDGGKIYRCPRSIVSAFGADAHFFEIQELNSGQTRYDPNSKPWKWHSVKDRVNYELNLVRANEAKKAASK
jgi:hypothetical protein